MVIVGRDGLDRVFEVQEKNDRTGEQFCLL